MIQTHSCSRLPHAGKEPYTSVCSEQKFWSRESLTFLFPSRHIQSNSKSFRGNFQGCTWSVYSSSPSWQLLYSKPPASLTTTVVSYLLCVLSCLLESNFDPETKVTFEKGKSDYFFLPSNPSTFHHIPRIKPKVVNSIHIDLHTLPDFSSCPQPYQYLYPTHNLCCGHSEVLLFEQAKFILSSGPLHVSFPLPGNHLSTFWIPPPALSPGLCSGVPLISDELFIQTLKIPPIPRTHI